MQAPEYSLVETEHHLPSDKIRGSDELDWKHKSNLQKTLTVIGYACAAIFALGCGISTAAAFLTANLLSAGAASYVIAGILFTAGTTLNLWLISRYLPPVLIDIFGHEKGFCGGLVYKSNGEKLSVKKQAAMGALFVLACSVGITFGALTYVSTFTLTAAFGFLAGISAAFPPIAAVLAMVTVFSLTALMLKDLAGLIKSENAMENVKNFFMNLVNTDPTHPQNKLNPNDPNSPSKSPRRILAERTLIILLTALALPLVGAGLYFTGNSCSVGVKSILLRLIPRAAMLTVDVVSKIIALGLATLGQLPFAVISAVRAVFNLLGFSKSEDSPKEGGRRWYSPLIDAASFMLRLLNAIGNGAISMNGATPGSTASIFAGFSGAFVSFSAFSKELPPSVYAPSNKQESTSEVPLEQQKSLSQPLLLSNQAVKPKEVHELDAAEAESVVSTELSRKTA